MLIGLGAGTSIFVLVIAMYFIWPLIFPDDAVSLPAQIQISATAIPPPPPVDDTKATANSEGGESSGGGDVGSSDAASSVAGQAGASAASGIAEALSGGIFGEGGGIPTATAGASDGGASVLSNAQGGGLGGLGGTGLGGSGVAGGGDVGFGGSGSGLGSGGGVGGGTGGGTGLGGRGGGGLGVGGRQGTLNIRAGIRNTKVSSEGGRSADEIKRVFSRYENAILECYSQAKGRNSDLRGSMTVSILIRPDGGVANARVVSSSIKDEGMERCVTVKLKRMTFNAVSVQEMQKVDNTYNFSDD
ncbi:MAG: AgmX/PglI C-terminal domain-containing protein [Rhizobacter sp.]|nr:AgmX/PglI C-terminal domain-containing protein [Chlorobiales bacterium]